MSALTPGITPVDWAAAAMNAGTDKARYMPYYRRSLAKWIGRAPVIFEVGVFEGGSLRLWRDLFPAAWLHALDINPLCARFARPPKTNVKIGSQADPECLRQWLAEANAPVDVFIDDGSHIMDHIKITFKTVFPSMVAGTLYVIEDLGTSYWKEYGGQLRHPETAIEYLKALVDEMHSESGLGNPLQLGGITFHHNICFIEKR